MQSEMALRIHMLEQTVAKLRDQLGNNIVHDAGGREIFFRQM